MKGYLILLPILFLALIQGAFLQINLVLLLVIFWSALKPEKRSLWVAFWAGLFLDLAKGTFLGFSSFYFLVFTFVLILYSRKFNPAQPFFLFTFVFLAASVWNRLNLGFWGWWPALILAGLALVLKVILKPRI